MMLGDVSAVFTTPSAAKGILTANRDAEYIQSFTRVDLGDDSDEEKFEEGKPLKKKSEHKSRRKDRKRDKKGDKEEEDGKKDEKDGKATSPRISSKSTFAQISKELKAKKMAQLAAAAKARKSKKNKVRRQEEIYTDKDRAAAVNMGTRDIKQSLKLKKKQDRNHFQLPEEAEPGTLLALGNNELRSGDVKIALKFVNKALELNPGDKNSLVARSKCYLLLGEPSLALRDAEAALCLDKTFIRAIHQKAEALYHLGDFEHSLMYYHRGHRLRPELEIFRLGVQKAQEAIENTIGCVPGLNGPQKITPAKGASIPIKPLETNRSEKSSLIGKANEKSEGIKSGSSLPSGKSEIRKRRSKSACSSVTRESKNLLGELGTDRIYLENLLKNPDIICSNQEATSIIIAQAEEGIAFLKSRQEFWRQQRPNTAQPPTREKLEEIKLESQAEIRTESA